jgi:hypothetical protein
MTATNNENETLLVSLLSRSSDIIIIIIRNEYLK